ncbi:molybdopterin-guanine dinucleotide biosynthesis protein B [Neptunicoccus cionae]|uniref:molybdopterin-guanine dinucleotide biosynthesis protein B n=1 Tax=Neptunicoccus cionae TaxID=2035344 RepID=UPI000C7748AC|nr:molybdopterin-guanine dinucleotide biosynthesis protein B [Amylibacter cionae]PLS23112.1 molybdopterin-guanine dinucleotide biosynthesis protein B [Amylibacter cionae]
MKVFGITGWKNTGKTSLVERLVANFTARGLVISTVKHAHHNFDVDQEGRDSFRHRESGAQEVLLCSGTRWALMHELRDAPEPPLRELLTKLSPVDLVLVEGFKTVDHAKLECHRNETGKSLLAPNDPTIVAVASDAKPDVACPLLDLDDTDGIADFILGKVGL